MLSLRRPFNSMIQKLVEWWTGGAARHRQTKNPFRFWIQSRGPSQTQEIFEMAEILDGVRVSQFLWNDFVCLFVKFTSLVFSQNNVSSLSMNSPEIRKVHPSFTFYSLHSFFFSFKKFGLNSVGGCLSVWFMSPSKQVEAPATLEAQTKSFLSWL